MRRAGAAVVVIAAARVLYLIWLSPYELVADEAQYWDWSRRLSLAYYSKGPGIAWAIAISTSIFGVSEWAVRLPAAIAYAITGLAVARLATAFAADDATAQDAALIAVLLVALLPVYQLTAIIMTTDAPYIACWALALLAAWRAYAGERDGRPSMYAWVGCGAAIGIGFLFKYTMLLLLPGLIWFAARQRAVRQPPVARRVIAAFVAMVLPTAPIVIWNIQHDGAGVSHLLGYFAVAGGDRPVRPTLSYDPMWTVTFVLGQLGVVGPALALFAVAVLRGRRVDAMRLAVCSAAPTLIVFLVATLRSSMEANWPAAAYVGLIPVAACTIAERTHRSALAWWRGALVYGIAAGLAMHAPLAIARVPGLGEFVPTHRFRNFAARARQLSAAMQPIRAQSHDTLIVTTSHNLAGLLAFYLPGRPVVASAGRNFGDRPSAYDFFADTDLGGPVTYGRAAVLIGSTHEQWQSRFVVDDLTLLSMDGPQWVTRSFRGMRQRCDGC